MSGTETKKADKQALDDLDIELLPDVLSNATSKKVQEVIDLLVWHIVGLHDRIVELEATVADPVDLVNIEASVEDLDARLDVVERKTMVL